MTYPHKKIKKLLRNPVLWFGILLVGVFIGVRFVYPNWVKPYMRTYLGKQDAQERQELEVQYHQALEAALQTKDAKQCDVLPGQVYQYLRNEDGTVHYSEEDRVDRETSFPRNQCVVAYAVQTLDDSVCASLESRNHCYLEVANAMKFVSDKRFTAVCARITQSAVQSQCLTKINGSEEADDLSTLNWGP